MRKPKLHNRIGRSVATLPVCSLMAVGLWWLPQQAYSHAYAVSLVLVALTAYVILETNNTNQLIRTRSRMMASVWVFGAACFGALHPFHPIILATFCLAVSYYLLFRAYQKTQPVVDTFHTFVVLSLGGVVYPPMLLFAPFYLWYLIVFMRAISFRSFLAALIGLLLPFWFWTGYLLWMEDLTPLVEWSGAFNVLRIENLREMLLHLQASLLAFQPTDINVDWLISNAPYLLLVVLTIWTSVYYLSNSYDDKIRTRMMLYIYVFQSVLIILMTSLFDSCDLLPLLLLSCSPLIAHYFTLRNTWVSLIVFILTLMVFAAVAVITLWPESLNYMR